LRSLGTVLDNQKRQETSFSVASQVIARSADDPEYSADKKSICPHRNDKAFLLATGIQIRQAGGLPYKGPKARPPARQATRLPYS
jgi:hypothetical protein